MQFIAKLQAKILLYISILNALDVKFKFLTNQVKLTQFKLSSK